MALEYKCPYCGKLLPRYYVNRRKQEMGLDYWGDRGRYNFRGATANALKHVKACGRNHRANAAGELSRTQ